MKNIDFKDFKHMMLYDISKNNYNHEIEIEFCVDNSSMYKNSWLGKMLDKDTKKEVYWFGLTPDGSQAYDYESFEELVNAKVFNKKSIKEIWDTVALISINASDVEEMLSLYLAR